MPGKEFLFDRLDLQSEFQQLGDERPKSYARQGRKINGILAEDFLDQCAHMPDALRDHDPKLRKMRSETETLKPENFSPSPSAALSSLTATIFPLENLTPPDALSCVLLYVLFEKCV
jgi:hypothetical protein